MKAAMAMAALLAWQTVVGDGSPEADPSHLRYQREVTVPGAAAGQACVVLDAAVYAHAAEASARDVRLFAQDAGGRVREVPFALSESATQPVETVSVPARNAVVRGNELSFDLEMPHRAYSVVELALGGRDFVGVAHVTTTQAGGKSEDLGAFTVFDLSGRRLGRSTTLALAETSAPVLHVEVRLTQPDGRVWPQLAPGVITGATIPPSREAQVLYTVVAQATPAMLLNDKTIAVFPHVAAHVPVERVSVTLKPEAPANFLHTVTTVSRAAKEVQEGGGASAVEESMAGTISRVTILARGAVPAIHYEQLHVNATLGTTLSSDAEVEVAVDNDGAGALPIASVALEMRQRSLCFEAAANERYVLRYGDVSLAAPHYGYARQFAASEQAMRAKLGPEELNPRYTPRVESRSYVQRHPEAVWVGLLGGIAVVVLAALESVKRQRHR